MHIEVTDFSPKSLAHAINEEWGIGIKPHDIYSSTTQGRGSHVAFAGEMAFKFYRTVDGALKSPKTIGEEAGMMRVLENAKLGVEIPRILHIGSHRAVIAMSKIVGSPVAGLISSPAMHDGCLNDTIIEKLAAFIIQFDEFIKKSGHSVPVRESSDITSRISHNDFNPGNIVVTAAGNVGLLDFESVLKCDPHKQFVPMLGYHGFGPVGTRKLADAVNRLSKTGTWIDMDRVYMLAGTKSPNAPSQILSDAVASRPHPR